MLFTRAMFAKTLANDQRKEERGKRFQKPKKTTTTFQRVRSSFLSCIHYNKGVCKLRIPSSKNRLNSSIL